MMIPYNLGGGIFLFAYFQNGGKRAKTEQKVAYHSKYCFHFDDVYIELYIFWGGGLGQYMNSQKRLQVMLTWVEVKVKDIFGQIR